MSPLVTLLLRSIAGKAFQKAPEGSALHSMGTKMEKYDPISGIYNLFQNAPVIGEKIQGFKSAVAPMPYGTSQKQYNEYQGIVDSSSGLGSFGDLISGIYGEGGVMQGYNPVKSALEKIEYHEKICRIMQKQTFAEIKELKNQVRRMEWILIVIGVFLVMEFDSAKTFLKTILEIFN
jgi:hypothetical protein